MVYIANPGNPTGTYVPFDEIRRLHAGLPADCVLVLDAAYAEYVRRNDYEAGIELVSSADNVVMTRTFSKIHGLASTKGEMDEIVQKSLKRAGLWDEVADRLHSPGTGLSGGQQQRLVIARAIAVEPEVILMDEPCSALDPIATAKIEELIDELRERYCIVIVTHSMAQAARVSQRTAFFHMGKLVETGDTEEIFTNPREKRTLDYITGRFG